MLSYFSKYGKKLYPRSFTQHWDLYIYGYICQLLLSPFTIGESVWAYCSGSMGTAILMVLVICAMGAVLMHPLMVVASIFLEKIENLGD